MLKVGVIGIGNAGNQVAEIATRAGFPSLALNTSVSDTETLQDVHSIIIGDQKGSGKDRATAKGFAKEHLNDLLNKEEMLNLLEDLEVLAIVSSTGGGTGSGMAPVMSEIISKIYPAIRVLTIGITPSLKESIAAQQNTIEYLQEVRKNPNRVYALYDNEQAKGNLREVLTSVNSQVVNTLSVIRGDYQKLTPLNSIDDKDMLKIISTPGRLAVASITGFQEKDIDDKSIEERLLEEIKSNAEVEFELDKIVRRFGIIVNLNDKLFKTINIDLPIVKEYVGEPIEGFEHVAVDENGKHSVHVLFAGLSIPDDRIMKITQRIEQAMEALSNTKESSILDSTSTDALQSLRNDTKKEVVEERVNVGNIFDDYL